MLGIPHWQGRPVVGEVWGEDLLGTDYFFWCTLLNLIRPLGLFLTQLEGLVADKLFSLAERISWVSKTIPAFPVDR